MAAISQVWYLRGMKPIAITILIGVVAGVIGGLLGVGGGIVMVPCFKYFLERDFPTTQRAVGTSLAVIAVASLAGAARHASLGNVNVKTVAVIVAFVAMGSYLGADLTQKISSAALQKFFAIWMIGVGIYMLTK